MTACESEINVQSSKLSDEQLPPKEEHQAANSSKSAADLSKNPLSTERIALNRDHYKKCIRIIHDLLNKDASIEFRKPVFYIALGLKDYRKIVKKPMDLNFVRRNLNK